MTPIHDCRPRRGIEAFTVVLDQVACDHPVRQIAVRNRRPQHRRFVGIDDARSCTVLDQTLGESRPDAAGPAHHQIGRR